MGISEVYITILTDFIKEMIPIAFFVFAVKLVFKLLYSALSGRLDI